MNLHAFARAVYEACHTHIEARKEIDRRVCGDCPVRKLRARAQQLLNKPAEPEKPKGWRL